MAWGPAAFAVVGPGLDRPSVAPLLVEIGRGAGDRPRRRHRHDRPGRLRRLDPGRPRARGRLLDRRRRGRRPARVRGPRPRRLGAGADLDPRLRRHPERVRRLGRRASRDASAPAGSPDLRGWAVRSPLLAVALGADRHRRRSGCRGSPRSRPARPLVRPGRCRARSARSCCSATFAPLAYEAASSWSGLGTAAGRGPGRPSGVAGCRDWTPLDVDRRPRARPARSGASTGPRSRRC